MAGRLEGAFDDGLHGLLGQGGAVDDHRVEATGLGNQWGAGGAVFGHIGADAQGSGSGAGEGHPVDASIAGQRRADLAAAGQELQGRAWHARLMQHFDGEFGDQRRLLSRFGQHGIASRQRRCDLPAEDRQREVPRRDAGEDARRRRVGRLARVVAQEVHRLAQLGHAVGQTFASFAGEDGKDLAVAVLQHIGCAEQGGAAGVQRRVPRGGVVQRRGDIGLGGRLHRAGGSAAGRVADSLFGLGVDVACKDRRGGP